MSPDATTGRVNEYTVVIVLSVSDVFYTVATLDFHIIELKNPAVVLGGQCNFGIHLASCYGFGFPCDMKRVDAQSAGHIEYGTAVGN